VVGVAAVAVAEAEAEAEAAAVAVINLMHLAQWLVLSPVKFQSIFLLVF